VGCYSFGYGHFMKPQRVRMTHDLLTAYNMLDKMKVVRPRRCSPEGMAAFHTDEYIDFLTKVTPETVRQLTLEGARFLTGEDNPAFDGLFEFCSISAGGSVAAAQSIEDGSADIAINWAGGLHHAKKREASGFCYINDIVLAILELLRTFPRVLYVDIDCHHGDGVEEAFYTTDRVMTCSFHKFGDYFPGTGHINDKGKGRGYGYSVNVPLRDGLTDESFKRIFQPVVDHILEWYRPSAVVLQCGADSLAGDKLGRFNVTMEGHASCVQHMRKTGLPLILLGGGGYTMRNVARTWTYETACALGIEDTIDRNLPWHDYFEWFGPRFKLEVLPNNMDDHNTRDGYLDRVERDIILALKDCPFAPSVAMQDTPQQSVSSILGRTRPDQEEDEGDRDAMLEKCINRYIGNIDYPEEEDMDLDVDDRNMLDTISQASSEGGGINFIQDYLPSNDPEERLSTSLPRRKKRKFFRSALNFNYQALDE